MEACHRVAVDSRDEVCTQQRKHSTVALPVHVGGGRTSSKNHVKKLHSILRDVESSLNKQALIAFKFAGGSKGNNA